MASNAEADKSPKQKRTRNPPKTYTPSEKRQKDFNLNSNKTKEKRELAANRQTLIENNKHGNTIVTLNDQAYDIYLVAMLDHVEQIENNPNSHLEITEKRRSTDKSNTETEILLKFKVKNTRETCTATFYHTTFRILLNGKGRSTFYTQIHANLVKELSPGQNQTPSNLSFLDLMTDNLTNDKQQPRKNMGKDNTTAKQCRLPGRPTRCSAPDIDLEPSQLSSREGPDTTNVKTILEPGPSGTNTTNSTGDPKVTHPDICAESPSNNSNIPSEPTNRTTTNNTNTESSPAGLICVICDRPVIDDCIECSLCQAWLHFACENLSAEEVQTLSANESIEYHCASCFIMKEQESELCSKPAASETHSTNSISTTPDTQTNDPTEKTNEGNRNPNTPNKNTKNAKKTVQKQNNKSKPIDEGYLDKLVELRTEILRLENIVKDQQDTIRTLKIKLTTTEANRTGETSQPGSNPSNTQNNTLEARLQSLETENIKRRLDLLELQIRGKNTPATDCPSCNHTPHEQSFLEYGRASQRTHLTAGDAAIRQTGSTSDAAITAQNSHATTAQQNPRAEIIAHPGGKGVTIQEQVPPPTIKKDKTNSKGQSQPPLPKPATQPTNKAGNPAARQYCPRLQREDPGHIPLATQGTQSNAWDRNPTPPPQNHPQSSPGNFQLQRTIPQPTLPNVMPTFNHMWRPGQVYRTNPLMPVQYRSTQFLPSRSPYHAITFQLHPTLIPYQASWTQPIPHQQASNRLN